MAKPYARYLCCMDLTFATRIIAGIGLAIGFVISIALINDGTKDERYYESCVRIALALGLDLDWFHVNTNSTTSFQLQEHVIIVVLTVCSITYLITNLLLLIATILLNKYLTVPWLICESFHCVTKLSGLVYHLVNEWQRTKRIYVIGTSIYVSLMIWWMLVVYFAQKTWHQRVRLRLRPFQLSSISSVGYSSSASKYNLDDLSLNRTRVSVESTMDSPASYCDTRSYPII